MAESTKSKRPKVATDILQTERKIRGLTAQLTEQRRLTKRALVELEVAEARFDVALAIKDADPGKVLKIRSSSKASTSVAHVIFGDWHVEERVDPKTVNGINSYNLRIAERRIDTAFANALKMIQLARLGTKVDTVVLSFLGDLMTGFIHEELVEGNALSPVKTILWLKAIIVPRLNALIEQAKAGRFIVVCNIGNHGRTTMKPRVATKADNSYEWLLYHIMKDAIPNAEWRIADGAHVYLDVFGLVERFSHGDDFKYGGGVGGITIPVLKGIANWDTVKRADLDVFGHWHQRLYHRRFVANASLIGHNAYAIRIKAQLEKPTQTFFLVEKDYGITMMSPIFLS